VDAIGDGIVVHGRLSLMLGARLSFDRYTINVGDDRLPSN